MKAARAEQLQPPLGRHVRVRAAVKRVDDSDLLHRLDRWVQKLLNEHSTPDERR